MASYIASGSLNYRIYNRNLLHIGEYVNMYFYSDDEWRDKNIDTNVFQFLYLRWKELFEEMTYLSWQIRTSDLQSIIWEIFESIDITLEVSTHHPNILHLCQELLSALDRSKTLQLEKPQLKFLVDKLVETYNNSVKGEERRNIKIFRSLLTKIEPLVWNNKDLLLSEIERIISKSGHEKKLLDLNLSLLATVLKNEGYSYFYLKSLISKFEGSSSFHERFSQFKLMITRKPSEYICYYLIKASDNDFLDFNTMKLFRIYDHRHFEGAKDEEILKFLQQDKTGLIIELKVNKLDSFSAISESYKKLNEIISISGLYKRKTFFSQIYDRILVKSPNSKYHLFNQSGYRFIDVRDSAQFKIEFEKYIEIISKVDEKEKSLISASIKFFNFAKASKDENLKFLNLWIGLETLFQESDGKSIIARVRYSLPQIISSYYLRDLLREICIDIKRNSKYKDFDDIKDFFPNSTSSIISPQDLLIVLTDKKDGEKIRALLEFSSNNELFVYRINQIWNDYFQTKKQFLKRINDHIQNIDWQLMRLYRIRNNIIHQGSVQYELSHYTHHLNQYYHSAIHSILNSLIANPKLKVLDAITETRENFEYIKFKLKEEKDISFGELYWFNPQKKDKNMLWNEEDKK